MTTLEKLQQELKKHKYKSVIKNGYLFTSLSKIRCDLDCIDSLRISCHSMMDRETLSINIEFFLQGYVKKTYHILYRNGCNQISVANSYFNELYNCFTYKGLYETILDILLYYYWDKKSYLILSIGYNISDIKIPDINKNRYFYMRNGLTVKTDNLNLNDYGKLDSYIVTVLNGYNHDFVELTNYNIRLGQSKYTKLIEDIIRKPGITKIFPGVHKSENSNSLMIKSIIKELSK